ncbi:hypothetical protein O988_02604 [Pseudogymnoascus sp. VKM F-3808]|nr:hypothetical protein O988_02604 [Pseudogymnoascus sp. VKM F-3808]
MKLYKTNAAQILAASAGQKGKKALEKVTKEEQAKLSSEETTEKMISAVLTGVNRALPFSKSDDVTERVAQGRWAGLYDRAIGEIGTLAVRTGSSPDPHTGAVALPITLSSTYAQLDPGQLTSEYIYSRKSNPNRSAFEAAVAALENAKFGLAFGSGSATVTTILQTLEPKSHVLAIADVYSGTRRYFVESARASGTVFEYVEDLVADLGKYVRPNTKLVWIESPSNPLLKITDISAVAKQAHQHGMIVVVDNTLASPYNISPLDHGADITMHSATKWLSGHADTVLGVLATNSPTLHARLSFLQNAIGAVPSPFDSYLAHRGLKTLHLRAERANASALAIALALEASPDVITVSYPGLPSHPQRKLVLKQHKHNGAGGGIIAFRIRGGYESARRFCLHSRLFTLAESFGGVQSLAEVPGPMTHVLMSTEERAAIGVADDLIRLSCGVEETEDLVDDVLRSVESAVSWIEPTVMWEGPVV